MPSAARATASNYYPIDDEPEEIDARGEAVRPLLKVIFTLFVGVFFLCVVFLATRQPLTVWDESRSLFNALELSVSKHWIVPTYNGLADHWYTKPPLLVWIVTVLIRLGFDPMVALRTPSLIAVLLSVMMVYFFASSALRRPLTGMASVLLLLCSTMFFAPHVALTGDLDALLSLLETGYALAFWLYVESGEKRTRWLVLGCVALTLAALTKGIAGVLFLPGLFVFMFTRPDRAKLFRDFKIWVGLAVAAGVILSYYKYRDSVDPGYIQAVFANEVGRYSTVIEGHKGGPSFYLVELVKNFEPGFLAAVLGCWFIFDRRKSADKRGRSAAVLCATVTIMFLVVLSGSRTKFGYYSAPALPLLSLLGGMGLVGGANAFVLKLRGDRSLREREQFASAMLLVLAACAFGLLVLRAKHVEAHRRAADSIKWSDELEKVLQYDPNVKSVTILTEPHAEATTGILNYYPVAQYWADRHAVPRGIAVKFAGNSSEVRTQTWAIECDPTLYDAAVELRRMERVVDSSHGCIAGLIAWSQ